MCIRDSAFIPPHQLGYTMDEVDTSRTHCSVVNYVAVPEGYSVALGQDGRLHLYDPQDNVCCVTMPKMFQPWFDIESPMGHIGTQARRRYLVSTRSPFEDVGHAAHRFAEHDDPETGEHWIDTDAHAMRAPSIAEDEPAQAEAPSCARALPRKG